MQGRGMAHGALGAIRRNSINLADVAQLVLERDEPFGLDAVVVGEQDDHGRIVAKMPETDKCA